LIWHSLQEDPDADPDIETLLRDPEWLFFFGVVTGNASEYVSVVISQSDP
jgi:hypothetical protein